MPKDLVTTEEVVQAILHRITTGNYMPGERLPSVRNLAQEIGSNRNTVHKAYQMLLEMGVIDINASGRRGFSVKNGIQIGKKTRGELLDYFYQQSVNLVWQGMASGISSDEILGQLKAAVGDVYHHREVRLIFFECNQHDAMEMGRSLIDALEVPVEYRVLDDFYSDLTGIIKNYDLIITTYHHLAEITEAIEEHGESPGKVIGIETHDPGTMLKSCPASKLTYRSGLHSSNNNPHAEAYLLRLPSGVGIEATAFDHPETVIEIAKV
jgi:GntR family transcriptional regulator